MMMLRNRISKEELKEGTKINYGTSDGEYYISAVDYCRKIIHLYSETHDRIFAVRASAIHAEFV